MVGGAGVGCASPLAFKGGGCFGYCGVGEDFLGVEGFASLHALKLSVFDSADLGAGEGGFVFERLELMGGSGHIELLFRTLELLLEIGDLGLFFAAERFLFGDEVDHDGALAYGSLGFGVECSNLFCQGGHLVAQAFCFDIVRLQDNQFCEIRMHQ